jgi:hypothetical protein
MKATIMKCNLNLRLLIFSTLANRMAEINCACIFAATIAANVRNLEIKAQPRICTKRKPPDKIDSHFQASRTRKNFQSKIQ